MSELIECLKETHRAAARRENASTQVLIGTWESNGHQLIPAITAALQTFGGRHAPIKETYEFLQQFRQRGNRVYMVVGTYMPNKKVPGFGSSFIKGDFDPLLQKLASKLEAIHSPYWEVVWQEAQASIYQSKRVELFPNLAFYTAAVAIEEGINVNFCESIMIEARISEWIKILKERQ